MSTKFITTTDFRQNLATIVHNVLAGDDFVLVLGRGPRAKKIKLSVFSDTQGTSSTAPTPNAASSKHNKISRFLNSKKYKNFTPTDELIKSKNIQSLLSEEILKEKYDL
ncbi:MAG: hypothetical protein WCK98_00215 [bacterium]